MSVRVIVWVCAHQCSTYENQKRASDPLEGSYRLLGATRVGNRNQILVYCKSSMRS